MKTCILILTLISNTFFCAVSAQETDTLLWEHGSNLHWKDFRGFPDHNSHFAALTYAEITYKVSIHSTIARFDFSTLFMKKSSWTKYSQDPDLLKHEQIHFNIAELHKRLLIQLLNNRNLNYAGFAVEVKRLGDSINVARRKMDDEFDADVYYVRDLGKINKWNRYVADALDRLKAYNRNSILVAIK